MRWLFLIIIGLTGLMAASCGAINSEQTLASGFEQIETYVVSPDHAYVAVMIALDYSSQTSADKSRIVIVNIDSQEAVYTSEDYFEYLPQDIQWVDETNQLVYVVGPIGNESIIMWAPGSDTYQKDPYQYSRIAVSHAGDRIVSWRNVTSARTVHLLTYPALDVIGSYALDSGRAIIDVMWSLDDQKLMIVSDKTSEPDLGTTHLYELEVSSGNISPIPNKFPRIYDLAWNSKDNWIVYDTRFRFQVFDLDRNCLLVDNERDRSTRLYSWTGQDRKLAMIKSSWSTEQIIEEVLEIGTQCS